ncbi:hypothetical protein GF319_13410 [Candidatus Bathyarchaeota archaeon]|nr:hypothetical protein [Candidatus Bathyarchaeota archaeon]
MPQFSFARPYLATQSVGSGTHAREMCSGIPEQIVPGTVSIPGHSFSIGFPCYTSRWLGTL